MLPRATHERTRREASAGKQGGRTIEIQRLIGRSLRSVLDLPALGERQITVDCDVIQADGGTRTASITGAWVALHDCLAWMSTRDMIKSRSAARPHRRDLVRHLQRRPGARSRLRRGLRGRDRRQLRHDRHGNIVEVQGTAEKDPFSEEQLLALLALARKGIGKLVDLQKLAVM